MKRITPKFIFGSNLMITHKWTNGLNGQNASVSRLDQTNHFVLSLTSLVLINFQVMNEMCPKMGLMCSITEHCTIESGLTFELTGTKVTGVSVE